MNDLVQHNQGGGALSVQEMVQQVNQIQKLMKEVMKPDVHYGKIPGTPKSALFKAGAEKIGMMFGCRTSFEINRTDMPDGHREYEVVCRITDRDGNPIGEGVGTCTTMEKKYRYRSENTGAIVPSEYWDSGKDQSLLGGPDFVPRKVNGKWFIHQQVDYDNPADYYNCVTPDTRLLTHDLRWIRAGDIQTGDLLIGVDEEASDYARNFAIGEAEVFGRKTETVYELEMDDGRTVRCNGEHKWLVRKVGLKGTEWVSTEEIFEALRSPRGRPRHWSIMSVCRPWEVENTREAGYLAGLLDADGSLAISQLLVHFAQQENVVLHRFESGMESLGFTISRRNNGKTDRQLLDCESQKQVYQVCVTGGLAEQIRALGVLRPPRLMERWMDRFDITQRRLEGRGSGAGKPARIVGVRNVGEEEIVLLGTSCKTYIAEGLVCHNTVLKMGKKRAYVDAIITCTAASDFFDQEEVIDTPELYPDHGGESPAEEPRKAPKAKATPKGSGGTITQGQARIVRKSMEDKSLDDKHICNEFGVKSIEEIPSAKINAVLEWIDSASG